LTHTQVSLDRCTGVFVLNLRAASISMESSYQRVNYYRAAAALACSTVALCPEALEALELALQAEAGIERAVKIYWMEQKTVWIAELTQRCDLKLSFGSASKFPDFPFPIIIPEELLAVKTGLSSLKQNPPTFTLRLQNRTLSSQAIAYRDTNSRWQVKWNE